MQASSLQKRRVTGAHAFFLGAFLALLALTPATLPYGGRFVTRGDFIEQQLPFILETRRILRSGLNSYSFNTFLGAPAVGSYAFIRWAACSSGRWRFCPRRSFHLASA